MAGKRWTGSTFADILTRKRWTGSAWVDLTIAKRWDGASWVDLFPGGVGLPTGSWTGGAEVNIYTSCTYSGFGGGCPFTVTVTRSKSFTGTFDSFSITPTAGITINSIVGQTVTFTVTLSRNQTKYFTLPLVLTNTNGSITVPLSITAEYFYEDLGEPGDPGNEVP